MSGVFRILAGASNPAGENAAGGNQVPFEDRLEGCQGCAAADIVGGDNQVEGIGIKRDGAFFEKDRDPGPIDTARLQEGPSCIGICLCFCDCRNHQFALERQFVGQFPAPAVIVETVAAVRCGGEGKDGAGVIGPWGRGCSEAVGWSGGWAVVPRPRRGERVGTRLRSASNVDYGVGEDVSGFHFGDDHLVRGGEFVVLVTRVGLAVRSIVEHGHGWCVGNPADDGLPAAKLHGGLDLQGMGSLVTGAHPDTEELVVSHPRNGKVVAKVMFAHAVGQVSWGGMGKEFSLATSPRCQVGGGLGDILDATIQERSGVVKDGVVLAADVLGCEAGFGQVTRRGGVSSRGVLEQVAATVRLEVIVGSLAQVVEECQLPMIIEAVSVRVHDRGSGERKPEPGIFKDHRDFFRIEFAAPEGQLVQVAAPRVPIASVCPEGERQSGTDRSQTRD